MLWSLLLPEHAGFHVLIPQTRVGVHITPTKLYATRLLAKGTQRIVQEVRSADHDFRTTGTASIGEALQKITKDWSYTTLAITISTPLVLYKRITLPFGDREKILQVLPFELEGQLPFRVDEAQLDVLVLGKQTDDEYHILVAAIHNQTLELYKEACTIAGITPHRITPDVFELAALCRTMRSKSRDLLAVSAYDYAVSLMSIYDGYVHGVRTLDIHLNAQAEKNSTALEKISYSVPLVSKPAPEEPLKHAFVIGEEGAIEAVCAHLHETHTISCIQGHIHKLFNDGIQFSSQVTQLRSAYIPSILVAIGLIDTQDVSLDRQAALDRQENLRLYQLLGGIALTTVFLSVVSLGAYFSVRSVRTEFRASSSQLVHTLTNTFGLSKKPAGRTLMSQVNTVMDDARIKLENEEKIWFSLSTQNRFSFLTYLQELSSRLDRQALGLTIKRLALKAGPGASNDTLVLEGSVPGFDQLRTLETNLASAGLFLDVPTLQEPTFSLSLSIPPRPEEGV